MGLRSWIGRIAGKLTDPEELPAAPSRFPDAWRSTLASHVPLYLRLPTADAERLEQWVLGFLRNIPFEGCSGLEITDQMRVTVAGWASLLVLNRDRPKYPYLRRVLIYPDSYQIKEGGFFSAEEDIGFEAAGESWGDGYVVLAWADCVRGVEDQADGINVILHEFAHQLDQEVGDEDGIPVADPERWRVWDRVIERDFERFWRRVARGGRTAMDSYGAENRAEFFAVATETFFEKPRPLKLEHPELYQLLRELYGFDPAAWPVTTGELSAG